MSQPFVLASGSPRRRELLEEAGYRFIVRSPDVEEVLNRALTLREIALCNATRKGLAIARTQPGAVVLAADTLVALAGEVIGKPGDLKEAISILRRLSGCTHEVCSAVFICDLKRAHSYAFHEVSRVRFRSLSERAIRDYVARVNPLDKAGAYAAQGHGARIVAGVEGSFTNVVGLPMEKIAAALRRFGIEPEER